MKVELVNGIPVVTVEMGPASRWLLAAGPQIEKAFRDMQAENAQAENAQAENAQAEEDHLEEAREMELSNGR